METINFFIISLIFIIFSIFSKKFEKSIITAPMFFVIFGLIFGLKSLNFINISVEHSLLKIIAELTLVIILFTDASRIHFSTIAKDHNIPIRLLFISLPIMIVLGGIIAWWMFDILLIWEAVILSVILSPTDAALGYVVISSPNVPNRIRQALNIESGLNDGLVLPVLTIFFALSSVLDNVNGKNWIIIILQQLIFGAFIGYLVGALGGKLYTHATNKKWMNTTFSKISTIALALLSFSLAVLIGGNGFIAAFIAGITIGNTSRKITIPIHDFAQAEGQIISLILFFLFGAVIILPAFDLITWKIISYALLSLTLIRIIPVFISLIGLNLKFESKLYLGWFGPRGVASIVFGLMTLENTFILHRNEIFLITTITVFLSIFLHGLTAVPFSNLYSIITKKNHKKLAEHKKVSELPLKFHKR